MTTLSPELLGARLDGVGGSEASVVLGVNHWRSAVELFIEKALRRPDPSDRMRLRFGGYMEPFIRQEYMRETGREVLGGVEMARHPDMPCMTANTDGALEDGTIWEAKTVSGLAFKMGWGDGPPLYYQIQVQHYMAVLGVERAELVALVGAGERLEMYEFHRDDDFIDNKLIPRIKEFWHRVECARAALGAEGLTESDVVKVWAPVVDASESTKRALGRVHGDPVPDESVQMPGEALEVAELYEQASATMRSLGDARRGYYNQLFALMGPASVGRFETGQILKRIKSGRGYRFRLDWGGE